MSFSGISRDLGGCRKVAIINRKGGTGKTTTAVNLAAVLALRLSLEGKRILLVDWDSQRNATISMGMSDQFRDEESLFSIASASHLGVHNLDVMGASPFLGVVEEDAIKGEKGWEVLNRALAVVESEYAFIIIDCPPSLSWLALNALVASTEVLVPMQGEYLSRHGVAQLGQVVELLRLRGCACRIHGVLFTMYDSRTKLASIVERDVRDSLDCVVFQTVIPRSVRVAEAPLYGKPGVMYDPSARAARAYFEFADEFLESLKVHSAENRFRSSAILNEYDIDTDYYGRSV